MLLRAVPGFVLLFASLCSAAVVWPSGPFVLMNSAPVTIGGQQYLVVAGATTLTHNADGQTGAFSGEFSSGQVTYKASWSYYVECLSASTVIMTPWASNCYGNVPSLDCETIGAQTGGLVNYGVGKPSSAGTIIAVANLFPGLQGVLFFQCIGSSCGTTSVHGRWRRRRWLRGR